MLKQLLQHTTCIKMEIYVQLLSLHQYLASHHKKNISAQQQLPFYAQNYCFLHKLQKLDSQSWVMLQVYMLEQLYLKRHTTSQIVLLDNCKINQSQNNIYFSFIIIIIIIIISSAEVIIFAKHYHRIVAFHVICQILDTCTSRL